MTRTIRDLLESRTRKRVRFVDREAREPAWKAVHRAADRGVAAVADAFVESVDVLTGGVSSEAVQLDLVRFMPGTAITEFKWDLFTTAFSRAVTPVIKETMRSAGEGSGRVTPRIQKQDPTTLAGVFDITNPRAQRIAATTAASLVVQVTQSTIEAMRAVIARAQGSGIPLPDQAAAIEQILRDTAGLDPRRAQSLINFRTAQIAAGVSARVVEERVEQLRTRLLKQRAAFIARHETIDAANAGQVELWNQAEEGGLLAPGIPREWIVTPQDPQGRLCPICEPMSGQQRPRGELFFSTFNGQTFERPPAHALCRCALALVIPDP